MPNDPVINNIAGMAMQILHEAQGVRDISGLHSGDAVESTAEPDPGSNEIIISNGIPESLLKSLICEYPILQDGTGDPSIENAQDIIFHDGDKITQIADNYKREILPKFNLISGTYNAISGEVEEHWGIIELGTIFDSLSAELAGTSGHILRMLLPTTLVQAYSIDARSASRDVRSINAIVAGFVSSYASVANERLAIYATSTSERSGTIYYRNDSLDGLEALSEFVKTNNLRFAYRLYNFRISSADKAQFYIKSGNNVFSSENGEVAEIKYFAFPAPKSSGDELASAPEQISRPETPAIIEPIAEEIKNQEDEEK